MSFSFSINSKSQSRRLKKPSQSFSAAADNQAVTFAATTRHYFREFKPDQPPPVKKIKPIAPILNTWPPMNLKNLPNLPSLSQTNGSDSSLQFQLDPASNPEATDNSMGYGLNLRQSPAENGWPAARELELRKLREDFEKLPEDTGMDEFTDLPMKGFGAALLSVYGWKEGQGIGRNATEVVKCWEVMKKKFGRGGLGFTGEFSANVGKNNSMGYGLNLRQPLGENGGPAARELELRKLREDLEKLPEDTGMNEFTDVPVEGFGAALLSVYGWKEGQGIGRNAEDVKCWEVTKKSGRGRLGFTGEFSANVGKNERKAEQEVTIVSGREMGIKELRSLDRRKRIRNPPRKISTEEESSVTERVNWLRNHIRVRIISKKLKGGRFFLKKGVVVDVVGPGICSIYMDESRELIQGVEQELLETALPKHRGPVLVLCGRYKGVYGSLLKRDSEKETGIVRDADTHEMLNVKLEQIAEYTGDRSDIGY